MSNKYLSLNGGVVTEIESTQISAGAGDAGEIVALNASGLIDDTMLPDAASVTAPASENLAAGDWVNLHDDSGTIKMRKADASGGVAKKAHGYVKAAVTAPANGTMFRSGINTNDSGLTLAVQHYLSATPGAATTIAPTTSGHIVQPLGTGLSATAMLTDIEEPIVRA